MPHIFFERLERRRSTQSIFSGGINGFNMGSSGMSQAYSSYSQSNLLSNSFSVSPNSLYSSYKMDIDIFDPIITCYLTGPPIDIWPPDIYNPSPIIAPIPDRSIFGPYPPSSPSWIPNIWNSLFQNLWTNQTPSMNYLNNYWTSPIQNNWLTPSSQLPSWSFPGNWSSPMSNYLQSPSYQPSNWGNYTDRLSKLKKVRNNLLAFFQNKGVLSDKQRQRLISSPFDKA